MTALTVVLVFGLVAVGSAQQPSDKERILRLEMELQQLQAQIKELMEMLAASDRRAIQAIADAASARTAASAAQNAATAAQRSADAANRSVQAAMDVARLRAEAIQQELQTYEQRETGTAFLVGDSSEASSFGLYSYLLFGSKPTDATLPRYRSAVVAWLTIASTTGLLREHLPKELINTFYMPVLRNPIQQANSSKDGQTEPTPDSVLGEYDFERARILLRMLPGDHFGGPYIISTLRPLSLGKIKDDEKFLYQDLSSIPPNVVVLWIREFQARTAQERFWEKRMMPQFALEMRSAVAKFAQTTPQLTAILTWLSSTNVASNSPNSQTGVPKKPN